MRTVPCSLPGLEYLSPLMWRGPGCRDEGTHQGLGEQELVPGEETAGNESLAKNTSCCEFRIMRRIMISVTIAIMALVRVGLLFTTGT